VSGYVDAGYVLSIGTLAAYGSALVRRERRARGHAAGATAPPKGEDATSRLLSMTEPVVDLGEPPLPR